MAKFVKYVHIPDLNGYTLAFEPGDDVPEWALAQIRNPDIIDTALEDAEPAGKVEPVAEEVPVAEVNAPTVEVVEDKAPAAPRKRTTRKKTEAVEAE